MDMTNTPVFHALNQTGGQGQSQAAQKSGHGHLSERKARETAQSFEAMFISTMLSSMKLGVDPDSVMGGGKGEAAYQSLVAEQYGKAVAEMGGIGIADAIYKEILKAQEGG